MSNDTDRFLGKLAFSLWDKKQGGHRTREYQRLQKQQYYSPAEIENLQTEKLTQLLSHAWQSSSWYRNIMEKNGILPGSLVTLADLRKFPITTKSDIRENTEQFISSAYQKSALKKAKTGGSTGVSLDLYFDQLCQQKRNAAQMYADSLAGWQVGSRVAAVWGNPPVARTLKQKIRSGLLEKTIYLDTMHLDKESMTTFVERWREFQPDVIFGHAHSIYIFASFLLVEKITDLRPKGIVATSMMLLDHERQVIEEAFNTAVTNRYGCEETGLIAVECEQHQGMHINSSHIILESVDDNGLPVTDGTPGKLVVTDLNNYGMPLIRYRIEDVGVLSSRQCSCGRQLPMLERLEGRVADFLKKKNGGQVAGVSLVERTLTDIPGLQQMQLVQESLDTLIVNRVRGAEYNENTDAALKDELQSVFGNDVFIDIRDVEKIPQEKSGKYRFSICKI